MHYQATKTMQVQSEAVVDLIEHIDTYTLCMVWSGSCRICYKQGTVDERVMVIWPGSMQVTFSRHFESPRWVDSSRTHDHGNRYAFLRNGELDKCY
ncbi:hypothetical protein NOF04DRAFT_13877 [Fusarium oxysporum II5]|uniref:Uncharacterized protein n=3 Tax=Fusarium oxysporum species complex TaxID=171631 RepID=N1S4C6_FUSC4|nr:uncharacterized protein FOIG_13707 [Fusarium odoratissimum NRRL 54006]EMT72441.1 hypothetical protein FOC4_g10001592 [Fusarium odoratissimum]EXL93294.1 hypothetical protein FOIG_13707 [Fusarium odoratissimum NRRL 54006]KAK2134511.1 hypothetical protein NOF04DRAFT_13877 [Fusarium oxysporum II5]TXC10944.1 hypothetical protein FocTR4_00007779 [Fusarium oxysporum f. sp. cubense]